MASQICGVIRKTRKELLDKVPKTMLVNNDMGVYTELLNKSDIIEKCARRFDTYLTQLVYKQLTTDNISIDSIVDDYFEVRPPFEAQGAKRKEFLDAIMAAEINNNFNDCNMVAIVSNDNGVKASLTKEKYKLFDTIGELFNYISENDAEYDGAVKLIESLQGAIIEDIKDHIESCDYLSVSGVSIDKDGITDGHDYDEYYVTDVKSVMFSLFTMDDVTNNIIKATLKASACISVKCTYTDEEYSCWDSEDKDYLFRHEVTVYEKHNAIFPVSIIIDKQNKLIKSAMRISLGPSNRVSISDDPFEE